MILWGKGIRLDKFLIKEEITPFVNNFTLSIDNIIGK